MYIREDLWIPKLPNYKLPDDITLLVSLRRVIDLMDVTSQDGIKTYYSLFFLSL